MHASLEITQLSAEDALARRAEIAEIWPAASRDRLHDILPRHAARAGFRFRGAFDETGRLVSLKSLIDHGPVAVMFYRGHWCPYCRLNVRAVIQAQDRIKALGAQTVAIMPETQAYAGKFKSEAEAPFPVLTDLDNGYALSLNLAIWLGTEIQRLLSYQDMASFQGNEGWVLPIPATFVVGRDGLVKARFVDPDFRKRMEIDDLIAALKSASEER